MKKSLIVILAIVCVLACVFAACDNLPTITFMVQDEENTILTVEQYGNISQIPTVSNGDKIFAGWYTDAECTDGNEWNPAAAISGELTVYAKWIDKPAVTLVSIAANITGTKVELQEGATEAELRAAITVVATKSDSTTENITDYELIGFNPATLGEEQTVTIKKGELTTTVTVLVKANAAVTVDLEEILALYQDDADWNFSILYTMLWDGEAYDTKILNYALGNIQMTYEYDDLQLIDYLKYVAETDEMFYYADNGDGTYEKMTEEDLFFWFYAPSILCGI